MLLDLLKRLNVNQMKVVNRSIFAASFMPYVFVRLSHLGREFLNESRECELKETAAHSLLCTLHEI